MENSTDHINQGRPVYFSYARNSSKKPEWEHISDCVDKLLETLPAKNLEYRVDVRDIGAGGKISSFEQEIGWKSEVVVVIFSDKYFRSMHCMYELVQIKNALKQYPEKKLFCIKSGDINLSDINYIMELEDYWLKLKNEYEKIEYHRLREHSGTEKAAWQNGFYLDDIRQLYSFFSAINYSNAASINYDSFVDEIVKYFVTTPKPDFTPKPAQFAAQPQAPTAQPQQHTAQPQTHAAQQQTHAAQPQTRTAQPQPQTHAAQPQTHTAQQQAYAAQPQTRTVQSQPKPQYAQNVQQVASTPQPAKKSSAFKWIMIIGGVFFLFIWIANNGSSSDSSSSGSSSGSSSSVAPRSSYVADNVGYDDGGYSDDAILDKGNALYNAGDYYGAMDVYEDLANKGNAVAQNNLGWCYFNLEKYDQAVKLFQKAANQGVSRAQLGLGLCYLNGAGVRKNISEGEKWIQKAADQGDEEAIEALWELRH